MELVVKFDSAGISLAGSFYIKDRTSGRSPGIVLAHGFAGARYPRMAAHLANLGYGVLAFDFRGYGLSGGERGRVIPSEQAVDIRSAVTWLTNRPEIDAARIGVVGSSLGGSIAIMAAADDDRVGVCVAGCPLGKGDSPMRMQYDTEEKFAAFLKKVEDKKRKNERLHRFDIVFIPENLRTFLPPGTPMEFSADTVYGFLAMKPMEAARRYYAGLRPVNPRSDGLRSRPGRLTAAGPASVRVCIPRPEIFPGALSNARGAVRPA